MTRAVAAIPAILVAALACVLPATAGTMGKLAGRVVDAKKQPLAGANVTVPTARVGALTDADGRYQIIGVPAGTYDVKVALLGYQATTLTGVLVSADNTTPLDITLKETPIQQEEVVVTAERPVIDTKITSQLSTVSRQEIQSLPVQELQELVNLQAGVVSENNELHFRGGRGGEVQFQVDGVTVNNVYDNKSSLRLDRSLLEEVQVVSGTFDAEYGQAMSGVVNAVLRRGTDRFRWDAELLGGMFRYDEFQRPNAIGDQGTVRLQNYQIGASGPLIVPNTMYLASARRYVSDDYIDAIRVFTPAMSSSGRPEDKLFDPDGDFGSTPLGYSREWSGLAKITNRSLKGVELNYQAVFNQIHGQRSNFLFRFDPEGRTHQHTTSIAQGLDWTHTLKPTMYYTLAVRQNHFEYRDMVYDDVWDTRYDAAGAPKDVPDIAAGAYVQGVDLTRFTQRTDAWLVKGSVVSQFHKDQQFKAGVELQWPELEFGTPGYLLTVADSITGRESLQRKIDEPPNYPGVETYIPYIASGFAQDELELNDLRIRAGLRADYFNARTGVVSDPANPANSIDGVPTSELVPTSRKFSLSPRIGISYPVTRDAALFFAYGHFYQMPALGEVFRNSDYRVLADIQAGDATNYDRIMGNPDIRPERTVQYQFGYKQALTNWIGLDVAAYYKDIRDLLGVEFVTTYNGAEYARYTNVDFGSVIGFTVALDQRRRGLVSSSLDYTWQMARGNSSNPRETATRAEAGEDPRPREVPFNWDQLHTMNAIVTVSKPNNFLASAIVRVASGQPYTPQRETGFGFGLETNSGRKPLSTAVDLSGEKVFHTLGGNLRAFARVYNLFDTRFFNGFVFSTTGSPYYSRNPTGDANKLADPLRYFAPRRFEIGVSMQVGG